MMDLLESEFPNQVHISNPHSPDLLNEKSMSIIPWNKEKSLAERFLKIVKTVPDYLALHMPNRQMTYQELDCIARKVVMAIKTSSLNSENGRIVIGLQQACDIVPAILGSLMAAKVYVPVDMNFPEQRLQFVLQDAEPDAVLIERHSLVLRDLAEDQNIPIIYLDEILQLEMPDSLPNVSEYMPASILYTSGSSGKPKGVLQNHKNLLFHIKALTKLFHINCYDRHSLVSSFIFDGSTTDLFCSILNGATLVPIDLRTEGFKRLSQRLYEYHVSLFHSTPSVFRQIVKNIPDQTLLQKIRLIILGGEVVTKQDYELYKRVFSESCLFVNGYGATETSGFVALNILHMGDDEIPPVIPIGKPPPGIKLAIKQADDMGEAGMQGELLIISRHLALGYWKNTVLTESVYSSLNNDPSIRVYHSGDQARRLADGSITLLGRCDRQFKIRGYRIELGEIEAALQSLPEVVLAAVKVHPDIDNSINPILAAYVQVSDDKEKSERKIRHSLSNVLPAYMLPSRVIFVERFMMTETGKIDIKQLSLPQGRPYKSNRSPIASSNLQAMIANIWSQVLDKEQVNVEHNFFDIGGNSYLMANVHQQLENCLNIEMPLYTLFQYPTVSSFASYIEGLNSANGFEELRQRIRKRQTARKHKRARLENG